MIFIVRKGDIEMELLDENMLAAFRQSGWEVVEPETKSEIVADVEAVEVAAETGSNVVTESSGKLTRAELEALSWEDFCKYAKEHGISPHGKRKIDVIAKLTRG